MGLSGGAWQLISYGLVLIAIIVIAAILYWVIRRMLARGVNISGDGTQRGRRSRLGVIDSFDVDRQRRLILLRRDNVEHLVMIGGPNDVLIESTIRRLVAQGARGTTVAGQPAASGPAGAQTLAPQRDLAPQPAQPLPVAGESGQSVTSSPQHAPAGPVAREPQQAPSLRTDPPQEPPRAEPDPATTPAAPMPETASLPDPAAAPLPRARLPDADLAAMAHKLEEALRRPMGGAPAPSRATASPLPEEVTPKPKPTPTPTPAAPAAPVVPKPTPAPPAAPPPKPAGASPVAPPKPLPSQPLPSKPMPSLAGAPSRPAEPFPVSQGEGQVSRGPEPPSSSSGVAGPARKAELPPKASPAAQRLDPSRAPLPRPSPPQPTPPQPIALPAAAKPEPPADLESLEAEMAKLLGRPPTHVG